MTADQTTSLVTDTRLDPIYVDVSQPTTPCCGCGEVASGQIQTADADRCRCGWLEDGSPRSARQAAVQRSDGRSGTGAVILRAVFPNPAGLLMPGMFVREELEEGIRRDGILVPQQGVTHNMRGEATALVVAPTARCRLGF